MFLYYVVITPHCISLEGERAVEGEQERESHTILFSLFLSLPKNLTLQQYCHITLGASWLMLLHGLMCQGCAMGTCATNEANQGVIFLVLGWF